MSSVNKGIKTNNHWNEFKVVSDLPPVVLRRCFSWMKPLPEDGYIKYGDGFYHVSEFTGLPAMMVAGDWQFSLKLTSGKCLLIERSTCGDKYKIGVWRGI